MKRKQSKEQSIQVLTILKWFAKFAINIIIYHLIVAYVFDYKTYYLPQVEEGYYIQPVRCKEGHKIYPLQYKEDEDISSWEKNLKYWGYIKDYKED